MRHDFIIALPLWQLERALSRGMQTSLQTGTLECNVKNNPFSESWRSRQSCQALKNSA